MLTVLIHNFKICDNSPVLRIHKELLKNQICECNLMSALIQLFQNLLLNDL